MEKYVWYATYGSNLYKDRFLLYIRGGKAKYVDKEYVGCTNKHLPVKDSVYYIGNKLYFSQKAGQWGNKSVAFIKSIPDKEKETICKLYLITEEQFVEINQQENGVSPDFRMSNLDIGTTKHQRFSYVTSVNNSFQWYGRILYIGEKEGYPIYTFTAKWNDDYEDYSAPCDNYLTTIVKGLKGCGLSDIQIYRNLKEKFGIKDMLPNESLKNLIYSSDVSSEINNVSCVHS